MPWAFTTVTATVNTTSTAGANATSSADITFTGDLATATPALQIGAQVVISGAVYSVTAVSSATNSVVTLFPQTGVAVPSVTSGTSLTFQNPLLQTGTDTTIGTAFAGLAAFRSEIVNVTTTAAVAVGATTMTISAPVQAIPLLSTFRSATDSVHRVVAWTSGTNTVTFSPALPTSGNLANGEAVTFISPGVLVSRGDGSTGLDIYTVNSTRVRVTGTLTWNAWAEQLVLAANCPAQIGQSSSSDTTAQLIFAGTITINGSRSSWGFGSGAVCPTPALIASIQGDNSSGITCIASISGASLTINSAAIQGASFINLVATYNNAIFVNSDGASGGGGNVLYTQGTYNGITINGYRWYPLGLTSGITLSNITLIGANAIDVDVISNVTYSDLSVASQTTVFNLRSGSGATGVGNIYITGRNTTLGSATGVSQFADAHPQVGGFLILSKQVNHSIKNIAGTALSGVKVASRDTLNGQNIDWATYYPNLTSALNGAAQKTYSWTTSGAGTGTTQAMILAHVATSTHRIVNLTAFAKGAFNSGTTSIVLDDNGTNTFTNNFRVGTVVSNTSSTLRITLSGSRTTSIPIYASFIYNGVIYTNGAVTLVSGTTFDLFLAPSGLPTIPVGTTIVLGIGIQFVSSFVHQDTRHIITAVTPANDNDTIEYQCTITPALAANLADNTQLTIQNLYTDYRNKTGVAGADEFDFYTSSYLHLPQQQELTLTGTGTLTNNWQLLNDGGITQATKATVDAYTTITTAAQFYDRAKSWWYDNFENLPTSQQGVLLVDRTGTLLDAGAYNITLNNTAGAVFAFASSTITIKTATFTDTLTTTGTITLSQSGTYSAGIVPATGTVAIAAAGTYDLSGWTFTSGATINNTSGGAVIVLVRYAQIANITATGGNISVKSSPVTFSGFPTANNANGVAPAPKFGLFSTQDGWTFYDVSSGSVQVSLSDIGPEASFTAVTDAIGWIRPPAQTIQATRSDNFSWADLYQEFTAEDGTPIIDTIPDPLPLSYDQANTRFELKSGETLTFAEVAATKEALTSSETGIQAFNTATLRGIQFISNLAYRRIILPNAFTVAMQADATAGAILIDFLLLREGATPGTYADPFAHGLASTASGLTDRPEVVTAFQNATFVGLTASEIRAALGLASANVDTQLSGLATQASVDTKASQASVDALNAKADDITALVL
jgi:hypothetical protein